MDVIKQKLMQQSKVTACLESFSDWYIKAANSFSTFFSTPANFIRFAASNFRSGVISSLVSTAKTESTQN